jgi:hypothetical protein
MDILKHYGFVVGSQATTNTIIIDYMIGNENNLITPPANVDRSSSSASNHNRSSNTTNNDPTESRQITDV